MSLGHTETESGREVAPPAYAPVQKLNGWLSFDDVRAMIFKVGQERGCDTWRACSWDMLSALHKVPVTYVSPGDGASWRVHDEEEGSST